MVNISNVIKNKGAMEESIALSKSVQKKLHLIPETSHKEEKTTKLILDYIKKEAVEIIDINLQTGVLAYLDAGKDKTIALRADIDAIATEHGPNHLCGHDFHTASLLGAMHFLCIERNNLPANVLFIFQPAEEDTTGASLMVSSGIFDKVPIRPYRLFGIHNYPGANIGQIVLKEGVLMAEKSNFEVDFNGRSGHGGAPDKCIDPIVAAASFVTSLQTVISRNVNPKDEAICAINSIAGGDEEYSAPESAHLTGRLRSFSHEVHIRMKERVEALANNIAKAYECRCVVNWSLNVPAVENSKEMYEIAKSVSEKIFTPSDILEADSNLASEDFAVFAKEIPGFFYWVGSGMEGKENAPWHDPDFKVDESYLDYAVQVLTLSAMWS